jgi:hypothetical protein
MKNRSYITNIGSNQRISSVEMGQGHPSDDVKVSNFIQLSDKGFKTKKRYSIESVKKSSVEPKLFI